jgi:hypothetical protein
MGLPIDAYEGLMTSNSKGRYLNKNIKKAGYSCARVR